jgi:hypothetical protein
MYKGNGVEGRRGMLVRDNWKKNWLITAVSFTDTLRNPDYVASNRRMNLNSELEKKCKDSAMLYFSALY